MFVAPIHTEFVALLRRSYTSQVQFARLCDVTVEAVNNWCRGRRKPPKWAVVVALALCRLSSSALEDTGSYDWTETLGMTSSGSLEQLARARSALAKVYHPDKGGDLIAMQRINAAYDLGRRYLVFGSID